MNNKEVKKIILVNLICIVFFIFVSIVFSNILHFGSIVNLIIMLVGFCCLTLINILFIKKCYEKLDGIDKYINIVLEGNYNLNINDYCIKDICNLKDDINKVALKLKEQSELLESEKKYLQELLENISFQIKTPLTDMHVISESLENEGKIKKDFILRNRNQIEKIEDLISSLLKLSRLDSGMIKLKKEKIKISSLITKSIQPIKTLIEQKKINIVLNMKNTEVLVDINWTSEAIFNIIKNACEHTNNEILIESNTNPTYTELRITDNGNGINKEDLPHIFERFYKRNKDSIGIGLNISKKIIEMQNGTIEVESNEKTTFIIKLFKENI